METTAEYLKRLLPLLAKPVPHSWRVQSYSKNKPIATVMAYIDARDTQAVLDAYCTYGWHRKHQMLNDRLYCAIGIEMPNGTVQWREDCGTESNEDKEKGQASDSFKRAGVNWGIGRFLYDMKIQYVTASDKKEQGKFPYPVDEQGKRIYDMTEYINKKNPNAPKAPVAVPEPPIEERVANMQNQGRSNPEVPKLLADSIINCKSRAEMVAIYNANPTYHTNDKFMKLINAKSAEFPKPQPTA